MEITIKVDGASRGNPGPSAVAWAIWWGDALVDQGSEYRGDYLTNNLVEWQALYQGLSHALKQGFGGENITLKGDSQLVIKQMTGEYRCKKDDLRIWFDKSNQIADRLGKVRFEHIPREDNLLADSLANEALNEHGY